MLGFPDEVYLQVIGAVLRGLFTPHMIVPLMSYMINIALPMYPEELASEVKDTCIGLNFIFGGIG
jgi:hypothetical protein